MSKITIKIKAVEDKKEKWRTFELEEAVKYGEGEYSKIKIEFNEEDELKDFEAGKKLDLEVSDDKTIGEGDTLKIPHPWKADRTLGQKTSDFTAKAGKGISEASKKATQKSGQAVEKAGKNMQKWPTWVLPVGIVVGVLLLLGIIYAIFKKK